MANDPTLGYELTRRFMAVMLDRLQATRTRLLAPAADEHRRRAADPVPPHLVGHVGHPLRVPLLSQALGERLARDARARGQVGEPGVGVAGPAFGGLVDRSSRRGRRFRAR